MIKDKLEIRNFEEADQGAAAQFILAIFKELNWSLEDADGLDNIAKFFHLPEGIFLVIDLNDNIIGCAGVKTLDEGVGLIKRFYVAKEFRGQGIAQQLMLKLETEAKNKGYKTLVLDVEKDDPRAQKFYEKHGFVFYSPVADKRWRESFKINELNYMRKAL